MSDALYDGPCVAGCQHYHGGEVRHHKDCGHYAASLTRFFDDRIRELEAENAALREARGGRVKPLVWEDWSARHRTNHTADTPFGRYGVMQFHFPDMHFKIEPPTGKPFIADTLETAKAAAQADYERRIRAAIEPAPVTPAEAARVLRRFVYETTHLSPVEDDGSHWCRISKECLEGGRAALRALADAGEAKE